MHFSPYVDPNAEEGGNKSAPYRMPPELPHIKSPGMNRRDLKYLENAENKENTAGVDYNGPIEDSVTKPAQPPLPHQHPEQNENNLFTDESLGISPLPGVNETCYTETFNRPLIASTPITNHFKSYKQPKDVQQEHQQQTLEHQQHQQHPQIQQHQQHLQQYANQPGVQPPP